MHIKNANCSKSRRNKNRNRGNLGGKKEQMKKITMVSVISVLFVLAASLTLPMLSGCMSKKSGLTPLSRASEAVYSNPTMAAAPSSFVLPSSGEEVWIIARNEKGDVPAQDAAGSGALMTRVEEKEVPLPLKHTEVRAFIQGFIGTVEVSQQFQNPYSSKIEAVYVFPLPHDAAVTEFVMTIGERRIRGIIRERNEAEALYKEAKRQGYVASLLTEERPNIFTQSVANIEPGKEILVNPKYFHTLSYVDGWHEFVFPMVVGPRFNPAGTDSGVGAVAQGNGGASQQPTEVQYLKPEERSRPDIGLTVDIQAGVPIEEFECKTHQITHQSP